MGIWAEVKTAELKMEGHGHVPKIPTDSAIEYTIQLCGSQPSDDTVAERK